MVPGKTGPEPPAKRQRTGSKADRYDDLKAVQHVQHTGDALSTPALSAALDTLLSSRKLSDADRKRVETSLRKTKDSLDGLKKKTVSVDSPFVRNALRRVANGVSPDSLFRGDQADSLLLKCTPPVQVNVVGSFLLGYSTERVADIAVEMPPDLFEKKDYLNYRYHDKRMLYLIYLARHFAKTEEDDWSSVSLTARHINGDNTKPALCVSHVDHPNVTICLIPSYADGLFEKKSLAANRKNVRAANESSLVDDPKKATPEYNASIGMDSTFMTSLQALHAASAGVPAFTETLLLLEAWCVRHRLLRGKFVLAALLADIIAKGAAPRRASREQMLRCAFNSICRGVLRTMELAGVRPCEGLDPSLLQRCETNATVALRTIEGKAATEDPWFGILPFLFSAARGVSSSPRPLSTLFDGFIRIAFEEGDDVPTDKEIEFVLMRTLVDTARVSSIEKLRSNLHGITLVSDEDVRRKVDTCQDTGRTEMFKAFWGEKAGLRRFKDGRIAQSLVWEGGLDTLNEMCRFTFGKYFGSPSAVSVIVGNVETAAGIRGHDLASNRAIAVFDELAKLLRSAEGLPLSIRGVHATSAHLRRCGAYPIRPDGSSRFTEPLDIVASFESSGAWPDDPVAISAAKAGFYIALKSALAEKGIISKATISFLEIVLGGFTFRMRIRVDKEKAVLAEGSEDADTLAWETERRVQHQNNIKHLGNPLIGNVVKLAKRWLNAHLLLSQMGKRADELVEVLVASVLSRPDLSVRKSAMGYFCQFLHLLAEFPWEACPLVSLIQDREAVEVASKDQEELDLEYEHFVGCAQHRFSENSDGRLPFALYTAWDENHEDAQTWFPKRHCPEHVVAKRIVATARSTLEFIETHLADPESAPSLDSIFETSLDAYDAVLKLAPDQTPLGDGRRRGRFSGRGSAIVGLDPVEMLRGELEKRLGTFALFLAQRTGQPIICVVWRPAAFADVKFSLREAPFRRPEGDDRSLRPSREEIVQEMRRIGHGFVVDVRFPKSSNDDGH